MNDFLTWDFLLTFAGCAAGTAIITEIVKKLFPKISSKVYQLISYFVALLILVVGQLATHKMTGWDVAALDIFNAAVVSLTSNGGYDVVHNAVKPLTDVDTEFVNEGDAE